MGWAIEPNFGVAANTFREASGLSKSELTEVARTNSCEDLLRTLKALQEHQTRLRRQRCLKRLRPVVYALEAYSKIIVSLGDSLEIKSAIWGPMRLLLMKAFADVEVFDDVVEGYKALGDAIPHLEWAGELFFIHTKMQEILVIIFKDLLELHTSAFRCMGHKSIKIIFRTVWGQKAGPIERVCKRFRHFKDLLGDHVKLPIDAGPVDLRRNGANLVHGLKDFEMFRPDLEDVKTKLANIDRDDHHDREKRLSQVFSWLGTDESPTRHADVYKNRHGDTGAWLFKTDSFRQWFDLDHCIDPLLWMTGLPGAGKSVLAATVISAIEKIHRSEGALVAYFYCRPSDDHSRGLLTLAKAMLSQLLTSMPELLPHMEQERIADNKPSLISENLATSLLETCLKSCRRMYVVIDGLDEFPTRDSRQDISEWFQKIINALPPKDIATLRCMFVSQDDGAARKDFADLSLIRITARENKEDIEKYCADWHKKILARFSKSPGIASLANVVTLVTARSQGMFLFAKLVCENLYNQSSLADLEEELQPHIFPQGLDGAYDRIMVRITGPLIRDRVRASASKLLGWLACAKRPLRWYEIQCAMQVDNKEGDFNPNARLTSDCKELCSSLVDMSSEQTVSLVHSTARPYLVRKDYVNPARTEAGLALLCLRYLNHPCFRAKRPESEIRLDVVDGKYALADYAICFWPYHLETGVKQHAKFEPSMLSGLATAFEAFISQHSHTELRTKRVNISDTLRGNLKVWETYTWFEKGCRAVAFVTNLLRTTGKGPQEDDILTTMHTNITVRRVLEGLAIGTIPGCNVIQLQELYGKKLYKCERLNCQYFFRGFENEPQRKQHIDRHKRNHVCDVQGCDFAIIGCTSAKALATHKARDHGLGSLSQSNARSRNLDNRTEHNKKTPEAEDEADDDEDADEEHYGDKSQAQEPNEAFQIDTNLETQHESLPELLQDPGYGQSPRSTVDHSLLTVPGDFHMASGSEPGSPYANSQGTSEGESNENDGDLSPTPNVGLAGNLAHVVRDEDATQPNSQTYPLKFPNTPSKPRTSVCHVCNREFGRPSNLKAHLATHGTKRSQHCSVCGKTFLRASDKQRHEKTHTGERSFVCEGRHDDGSLWGCRRRFARVDALKTHWKTHGGECMTNIHEEPDTQAPGSPEIILDHPPEISSTKFSQGSSSAMHQLHTDGSFSQAFSQSSALVSDPAQSFSGANQWTTAGSTDYWSQPNETNHRNLPGTLDTANQWDMTNTPSLILDQSLDLPDPRMMVSNFVLTTQAEDGYLPIQSASLPTNQSYEAALNAQHSNGGIATGESYELQHNPW